MHRYFSLLAATLLICSSAVLVAAQKTTTTTVTTPTTVTQTTQNPDGTFTVVEYPVGKQTMVTLDPVTITGSGTATILRDVNGTQVQVNLTNLPATVSGLNLYAVDPAGAVTSLGPITVTNGAGTFSGTLPWNRFMLVASPEATLTTYDPNTKVFFRSSVPQGFTVIPRSTSQVAITATTNPTTAVTQTATVTQTTANPDGTFTVIEYPVGKEIMLNLNPVTLTGAKGVATVLRDDNGTRIKLNLSDLPSDLSTVNLYAVDHSGAVTLLGPVPVSSGVATFTTTTPLDKFMLVAAPDAALTTYDANTKVFFRSAVPEGFAVLPHTTAPVGEKVGATAAPSNPYTVPMLNIPAYEKGDDTKVKVNFTGPLAGARANVFITPKKGGDSKVKMVFHELKEVPAGKVYTVWAVSPDNQFVKLGQILNLGQKHEAEVEAKVALPDFGLLVTMEDAAGTIVNPLGPAIGIVEIVR
jgi:Tfp pilus assembly protein FimT